MQKTFVIALCAAAALMLAAPSGAQDQRAAPDEIAELRKQLADVLTRLDSLESKHAEERDADQERIAELQARMQELQDGALDADRARILAQMADRLREQQPDPAAIAPPTFELAPSANSSTNLLNPAITVFVDTGGSISSRGRNKALNRFNLREVEVDFRAAVAPFADAVLIIAVHEEIESQRGGDVDIGHHFEIEEGYIDFHSLPGDLALRVGKFRNAFGRNNMLHTHDLPQVTRPLAVTKFFGPEGLATTGVSLSWLVPNPWDKYIELTGQIFNADGGHESPLLGGPNAENPAAMARLKFFDDVGENGTLEIGGSYLFAHSDGDSDFDGHTFGFDAAYQWTHPDPSKFRSFMLQGEFLWSHNDINRGFFGSFTNDSFGFYAFGQYQFHRDWYAGMRYDWTEFPNSASRGPDDWDWALSPYVSWYITEFLRLRGEYRHHVFHIDGDTSSEEAVFLQLSFVFGSHPSHPYWVNR